MPRQQRKQPNTVTLRVEAPGQQAGQAAADGEEVSFSGVPLFEGAAGGEQIDKIGVIRMEPVEEGHVGYLEPSATEEDIARRFGGGTFRLQAKTALGKPVSGGFRTVKLAGEPKFQNALSLQRWKRIKRQEAAADGDEPEKRRGDLSPVELWELQERKEESRRLRDKEEHDRRELEREAAHKRELERLRLEAEGRERDRRIDEERRDRERLALEERRERERRADEDRRTADQEQQRTRDREFYANMLAMQKDGAKAGGLGATLELLAAAKELFGGGGDGGGGDPVTALIQNLPALLDKSSSIATSIQDGQAASQATGPEMKLTGIHAVKLAQVVEHLRRQGVDPNRALLRMLDAMGRVQRKQGDPAPEQPAEGQPQDQPGEPKQAAAPAAPRRARVNVRRSAQRAKR